MDTECSGCGKRGEWQRCLSLPSTCNKRLCPNCGVQTGPCADFQSYKVCSEACVEKTWDFYVNKLGHERPAPDPLLVALRQHFGFSAFRESQREIIEAILAKRSVLAVLPTGRGKSLCYQLPAVLSEGVGFVVSPLIALMQDQIKSMTARGFQCAMISSDQSEKQNEQICQTLRSTPHHFKLVFVAPETFVQPAMQQLLAEIREHITLFAIDEAHCICTWGADFRPHYRQLTFLADDFSEVPILALTATATPAMRQEIGSNLNLIMPLNVVSSFNRPEIRYSVEHREANYKHQVYNIIKRYPEHTAIIVYCWRRVDCEELAAYLESNRKLNACPYHAGLSAQIRRDTLIKWQTGELDIICATIAFGMGIDKPNVRLVLHSIMPTSVENFYQESGRGGRDGLPAESIILYSAPSVKGLYKIFSKVEDDSVDALRKAERKLDNLNQMKKYCENKTCRRRFLLEYFGEKKKDKSAADVCNQTCDNCKKKPMDRFFTRQ